MSETVDTLKQQQTLEEAKTAALNAQAARILAEKAVAAAHHSEAAAKALFDVPASGYAGDVKAGAKSGDIESALLAARALTAGSQRIAEKLKPVLDASLATKPTGTPVLIYGYGQIPAFQALVAYRAQYLVVQKAIESALQGLNAPKETSPFLKYSIITPQLAGLALESADKLLGFFRTDYSVEGVDVKFEDNVALVNALAGQLSGGKHKYDVRVPALYSQPVDLQSDPIFAELTALADQDVSLRQAVAAGQDQLATAAINAAKPNASEEEKSEAQQSISTVKDALEFARAAQALYDTFSAGLFGADDKGQFPLDTIIRQNSIRNLLQQGSPLLAVRIEKAGGSYYTRKNFWSFFGGMPFFNMGGIVITYALFDGSSGRLLASGTVPVDGGFVRISNLSQELGR